MPDISIPITLIGDDDTSYATAAVLATLEQIASGEAQVLIEDESGVLDAEWRMVEPWRQAEACDHIQKAIALIKGDQNYD